MHIVKIMSTALLLLATLSLSQLLAADRDPLPASLRSSHYRQSTNTDSIKLSERDVFESEEDASLETNPSTQPAPLKYNDYAMNCVNDRKITQWCAADPYKYYCTSKGKLQRQAGGKAEIEYCKWCECVDLNPKPNCLLSLIGTVNCARDSGVHVQLVGLNDFDRALAIKYNLTSAEQFKRKKQELELDIVVRNEKSACSRPVVPSWFRKLTTVVTTLLKLVIPDPKPVKDCIVGAHPMDIGCEMTK